MSVRGVIARLRLWARGVKAEAHAVYLASRDPRTPWYAKLLVAAVAAYALSPIDLIPDFIPIIGYLDDLILVPLGIALAVKLIPAPVMLECRERAATVPDRPRSWLAAGVIIFVWAAAMVLGAVVVWRIVGK